MRTRQRTRRETSVPSAARLGGCRMATVPISRTVPSQQPSPQLCAPRLGTAQRSVASRSRLAPRVALIEDAYTTIGMSAPISEPPPKRSCPFYTSTLAPGQAAQSDYWVLIFCTGSLKKQPRPKGEPGGNVSRMPRLLACSPRGCGLFFSAAAGKRFFRMPQVVLGARR